MTEHELLAIIEKTKKKGSPYLNLSNNNITSLPEEIGELTHIQVLDLSYNKLFKLPDSIGFLTQLKSLDVSHNKLKKLPKTISHLKNLEVLNLQANNFVSLQKEIMSLTHLNKLILRENQIKSLPASIGKLGTLRQLDLYKNRLTELPEQISKLDPTVVISAGYNPIQKPPPSVIKQGIPAITHYFQSLQAGEDYVYEAKLVIIGEPYVGKTSLAKKLIDPECALNKDEPITEGIDIYDWSFPYPYRENINFKTHIWDFGGQHIIFATHNYFLTKRSLYILVIDDRKDEPDFHYWLKMIECFSWKSPVFIVLNEKSRYKKYLPVELKETFQNIKGFFTINLSNGKGLDKLIIEIKHTITTLNHVGREPFPAQWVEIRHQLLKLNKDHISLDTYLRMCVHNGVHKEKALVISKLLHDLGVILHFQEDDDLIKKLILNPRWVTDAVFALLFDAHITKQSGEFKNKDMTRLWKQAKYRRNHRDLIKLMLNFEHCYELPDNEKYIIPVLLQNRPSRDNFPRELVKYRKEEILHYVYFYPVMPKGIISKFIVKMHSYITDRLEWRNGVVLSYYTSFAEITEKIQDRKIKIFITGKERIQLLHSIQMKMKEIHHIYNELEVKELIPCVCGICRAQETPFFYDNFYLERCKKNKLKNVRCENSLKDVPVNDLFKNIGKSAWDVFISYSSLDENKIEKLVDDLNKNDINYWIDWDQINPGDRLLEKIEEGLKNSTHIVLCYSQNQAKSGWSQIEYEMTIIQILQTHTKRKIIPLIIDDSTRTQLPLSMQTRRIIRMNNEKEYKDFLRILKQ